MDALEELALLLRPAAGGLYLVSTGKEAQLALQRRSTAARATTRWWRAGAALARARGARAVLARRPLGRRARASCAARTWVRRRSDAAARGGPGLLRGRRRRRRGHRRRLRRAAAPPRRDARPTRRRRATRAALYPARPPTSAALPVSPLSIAERALDLVFALNPRVAPIVLGGDHSTRVARRRGARRARARTLGHRAARRAHRSARGAARREVLLRDLVLPRERAPRPRRPAGAGRHARVAPRPRPLGGDARRAPVLGRGVPARSGGGDRRAHRAPRRRGRHGRLLLERHRRHRRARAPTPPARPSRRARRPSSWWRSSGASVARSGCSAAT